MQGALGLTDEGGEWSVSPPGIDTVEPWGMPALETRAKARTQQRKGCKVQVARAMGICLVCLRVAIGLLIEQAVQDIRGIPCRALHRHGGKRRVVVGQERRELQGESAPAVAGGASQDSQREAKALPSAAGGRPIAPYLGRIERQQRLDTSSESCAPGLVMPIPGGNSLAVLVADSCGERRPGLRAQIAALGHAGGDDLAHLGGGAGGGAGREVGSGGASRDP